MGIKSSEVSVAHYGGYSPIRVSLVVEVDMSVEHDLAVNILDDVVAVEPIAVLIEIVGAPRRPGSPSRSRSPRGSSEAQDF